VITLPTALYYVSVPLGFGDTAAIWGYHAKVLSCHSIFSSNFAHEKVWTGTHPNYPLFLSFMHALFFSLADSFRDDWIKIWQSVSLLCAVFIGYTSVKKVLKRKLEGFSAITLFMAIACSLFSDGRVELNSALFVWLVGLALLTEDFWRISIYLLGFEFCKNEGLAGSLIFVLCLIAYNHHSKKSLKNLRYLTPWVVGTLIWLIVLSRLPSHHEQYPSRLLDSTSWIAGFKEFPQILKGCARMMWEDRVDRLIFFTLPILSFVLFKINPGPKTKRSPALMNELSEWRRLKSISILLLSWGFLMLGIFMAIYIISPWGPLLYKITFDRLFAQVYPALALSLVVCLSLFTRFDSDFAKKFGVILQIALIMYYGVNVKNNSVGRMRDYALKLSRNEVGLNAYRLDPWWAYANRLDQKLPPASRGALLNPKIVYFFPNYLLYPRVLYPTHPDVVAGTQNEFKKWEKVEQVPWQSLKLKFILDESNGDLKNEKLLIADEKNSTLAPSQGS
jgi:hypothetical protein